MNLKFFTLPRIWNSYHITFTLWYKTFTLSLAWKYIFIFILFLNIWQHRKDKETFTSLIFFLSYLIIKHFHFHVWLWHFHLWNFYIFTNTNNFKILKICKLIVLSRELTFCEFYKFYTWKCYTCIEEKIIRQFYACIFNLLRYKNGRLNIWFFYLL